MIIGTLTARDGHKATLDDSAQWKSTDAVFERQLDACCNARSAKLAMSGGELAVHERMLLAARSSFGGRVDWAVDYPVAVDVPNTGKARS